MTKYFFHLIELAEKGNQIISSGMNECLTLVNKGEMLADLSSIHL